MSCSHPYILFTTGEINNKTHRKKYYFRTFEYDLYRNLLGMKKYKGDTDFFLIPCGKCIDCRLAYRKQWSIRLLNELETSKNAYFLTLTYNDDNKPENSSLSKEHLSRFFKSLKEHYHGQKSSDIKYFGCGEYGSTTFRPHYHAIVYNLPDDDLTDLFPTDKGYYVKQYSKTNEKLFYSPSVASVWNKGFVHIGLVNFNSCSYVAGYVQKKLYGDDANLYKKAGLIAPFMICSKGLGKSYFLDHKNEIVKTNEIFYVQKDKIKSCGTPRYYQKLLEKYDIDAFNTLKEMNKDFTNGFLNSLASMTMKEQRVYFSNKKRKGIDKDRLLVRE